MSLHSKIRQRLWRRKVFKIKERILSGVENLDSMRFIVGRFTSLSPENDKFIGGN